MDTYIGGFVLWQYYHLVKGLSGETFNFVAVTQLTFDPFVLNFGKVYR